MQQGDKRGGRPREWPAAWSRLADAAGGIDALAERLETSRRVVSRWAAGGVAVLGPTRVALRYLARELGVKAPV